MENKNAFSFAVIAVFLNVLFAETTVNFSLSASTGDADFDLSLRTINTEAERDLPSFYSSLEINFGAPRPVVDHLLLQCRLSPAEAYMAFRLSVLSGKPVDDVVTVYNTRKKRGWGAIAKELGIKPGSKEFHELKKGGAAIAEHGKKHGDGPAATPGDGPQDDKEKGKGGGKGKQKGK